MKRREFLGVLGGAASWPLAARAQQSDRVRRIGVLMGYAESDAEGQAYVAIFREGLQKLGWAEGHNFRIDIRWAASDPEAVQRLAKELVALQPDLILSPTTLDHCGAAATNAHHSHHFCYRFRSGRQRLRREPVAKPGGNVTGFINLGPTLAGKWLELLKEIAPRVARVALLFNPATAPHAEYYLNPFKAAAASFAVEAIVGTRSRQVRARIRRWRTGSRAEWGLIVIPDVS